MAGMITKKAPKSVHKRPVKEVKKPSTTELTQAAADKRKVKALEKWKVGTKTKAGAVIKKVAYDPKGVNGKTTTLTIACTESKKTFDIYVQDAHHCHLHPDVRKKRANKKAAESKANIRAKGKTPAKAKAKTKTKPKMYQRPSRAKKGK